MIRMELMRRIRAVWGRLVFLVRAHWHAAAVADALHELEDEAAIYLLHTRGDERARHVLQNAQRALLDCGRGVKGWD